MGMLSGLDYVEMTRLGNVAAVYAIETYGTANHSYAFGEFARRYEANYGAMPAAVVNGPDRKARA